MIIQKITPAIIEENADLIVDMGSRIMPERLQYWKLEHYMKDFPGKWDFSFVAFNNEVELVGFLIVTSKSEMHLHINKMAVSFDVQSKGIGTAMLIALIEEAKKSLQERITLFTHLENMSAYKFYTRNGFVEREVIIDNDGEKRYLLELNIEST